MCCEAGKVAELGSPEAGRSERAGVYEANDGVPRGSLNLGPGGAENVLALRCIHASRRLDTFWKARGDRHAALNDPLLRAA